MKNTILSIALFSLAVACTSPEHTHDYKSHYQNDSGEVAGINFTTYSTTLLADGKDETLVRICATDSAGREITTVNMPFRLFIHGDATIAGSPDNLPFEFIDLDTLRYWQTEIRDGSCRLVLRSGTTAGKFRVEAVAEGLWPASHEIHTLAGFQNIVPAKGRLKPLNRARELMIGADISFLPQLEARGRSFTDRGEQKDAIEILKDHGFNYIRLRLFVNPENEEGYSPGKGFCGLEYTRQMAARTKKAGLGLLLNFHYSDYWADPQQQNKPLAWQDLPFELLADSMKAYTKRVLEVLRQDGYLPDMVQIGNEINHGMLWPEGHIGNPGQLARLLIAGTEAVRETGPDIVVMMHIALGGQNQEAVFWLDNMIARGVQFDILGLSYYPRWHGTLDDLDNNMRDLIKRYGTDVNLVEYSMYKRELHDIVFGLPGNRGKGTCIWEPLNTWSAIFDRQGVSTDELLVYDEIRDKYLNQK